MKRNMSTGVLLCAVWLLWAVVPAKANWTDFFPDEEGKQDASWPEPAKITIYTDELTGDDLNNFKEGVKVWTDLLTDVSVEYKSGDRPAGGKGVQISKVEPGSLGSDMGRATASAYFPPKSSHGNIDSGTIEIDKAALGKSKLMKNLGAHEFGHILGLGHHSTPGGRTNVMNPDFDENDPFIKPGPEDRSQLDDYYKVIPVPGAFVLGLLGVGTTVWLRRDRSV